ncbi:hypothetical protein GOP47_0025063 [Adiantum capillus-veneris]|uniref:Transmembrane protein n=1 Tax=Adiantum capillus-veneris TaxID=13818 RepID=A0A9D4U392_ADICA|nr:hypothetical protein GOP47_0025063 [Adiantum capillus-veneris]
MQLQWKAWHHTSFKLSLTHTGKKALKFSHLQPFIGVPLRGPKKEKKVIFSCRGLHLELLLVFYCIVNTWPSFAFGNMYMVCTLALCTFHLGRPDLPPFGLASGFVPLALNLSSFSFALYHLDASGFSLSLPVVGLTPYLRGKAIAISLLSPSSSFKTFGP